MTTFKVGDRIKLEGRVTGWNHSMDRLDIRLDGASEYDITLLPEEYSHAKLVRRKRGGK